MDEFSILQKNISTLQAQIEIICKQCNRNPRNIKILPVTKNRRVDTILELKKFGFDEIGENKITEIEEKSPYLKEYFKIHLVGKLQKNKVKMAVNLVECIHSIDSLELACIIENELHKKGKKLEGFVEINIAKEKTKSGIFEEEIQKFLLEADKFKFLKIVGFMTMPPQTSNPENSRPFFRKLKELLEYYSQQKFSSLQLRELSMGTTQDYPVAIEEGATILRIGEAIFGKL